MGGKIASLRILKWVFLSRKMKIFFGWKNRDFEAEKSNCFSKIFGWKKSDFFRQKNEDFWAEKWGFWGFKNGDF